MSATKLTDFKVLIFDVYATLIDWEAGIFAALQPLLLKYASHVNWTRSEALDAFSSIQHDLQERHPEFLYRDLLARVHELLEERLKAAAEAIAEQGHAPTNTWLSSDAAFHATFGQSIKDWPLFPDSSKALHALARHFKLVVLSNVDRESFAYTHANLSLGFLGAPTAFYTCPEPNPHRFWYPQEITGSESPFTLIVTAQDTHKYKPDLAGFRITLGCIKDDPALLNSPNSSEEEGKSKVLIVAQSLWADIGPAAQLGVKSVWIDRHGAEMELGDASVKGNWRFETLEAMAAAVERETD